MRREDFCDAGENFCNVFITVMNAQLILDSCFIDLNASQAARKVIGNGTVSCWEHAHHLTGYITIATYNCAEPRKKVCLATSRKSISTVHAKP